jgi:hypothetical protein
MIADSEGRRWTRRRWAGTIAGVFVLQLIAVSVLVRSVSPPPARPGFATRVHMVSPDDANELFGAASGLIDPALFALPSLHGFSGSAWLRYPSVEPNLANQTLAPEWLQLSPTTLGRELARYLASNSITPTLLVEEPLPPVLPYETSFSGEPVAPMSRLQVTGALAQRPLLDPIDLPSWPHADLVSNTVVRAAVDAAGFTFSGAILSGSGVAAADEYALRFIERARFKPQTDRNRKIRRDDLTWGTFVFLWHTLPATVTNAAAGPR